MCGRLLWWGLKDEAWKSSFNSAHKNTLSNYLNGLFDGLRDRGTGRSGLSGFYSKDENDDLLNSIFDGLRLDMAPPATAIVTTTIRRQWEGGFKARFRSATRYSSGAYSVIPSSDNGFQDEVVRVFRRIERIFLRRIPRSKLKRGLRVSGSVKSLRQIALAGCSPEFMAYVLWKAYWVDAPAHRHPLRRNLSSEDFREDAALTRSKVYWRFTQHARLLSPMGPFTSADAWAQLHYFAIVAFEIHRFAEDLAKNITKSVYDVNAYKFGEMYPWHFPFVSLLCINSRKPVFDLKISARGTQFHEQY